MSDTGRKDFSSKVGETVKPDSQKSTLEKAKEGFTDTTDKVARETQPEDHKSAGQSVADSAGHNKDHAAHGGTGGSIMDKTKNALGLDKKA